MSNSLESYHTFGWGALCGTCTHGHLIECTLLRCPALTLTPSGKEEQEWFNQRLFHNKSKWLRRKLWSFFSSTLRDTLGSVGNQMKRTLEQENKRNWVPSVKIQQHRNRKLLNHKTKWFLEAQCRITKPHHPCWHGNLANGPQCNPGYACEPNVPSLQTESFPSPATTQEATALQVHEMPENVRKLGEYFKIFDKKNIVSRSWDTLEWPQNIWTKECGESPVVGTWTRSDLWESEQVYSVT